jgi:hypothetical protein
MGIVIFSHLPRDIRELSYDVKKFKSVIKKFLLKESFYSINEYLEWSAKQNEIFHKGLFFHKLCSVIVPFIICFLTMLYFCILFLC